MSTICVIWILGFPIIKGFFINLSQHSPLLTVNSEIVSEKKSLLKKEQRN